MNVIKSFKNTGLSVPMRSKIKEPSQNKQLAKNQLKNRLPDFLKLSIRKATFVIGLPPKMIYTVFHVDLHQKPYKYHN